ncbi:MAG: glycosyltransferase family 2 protein [Fimbriimonadales bacterium]|nr:glycosyltransferase family 2 protein [Fimbriimonadales bacterium]
MTESKQPSVAVIIAAYNAAKYLADALASVRSQTFPNWECWVVDDGSTDDTQRIAEEWAESDPRFKVLAQQNAGPGAARNRALRACSPSVEACWFLDADDLLKPAALERCLQILRERPEVVTVGTQFERIAEDGTPLGPGHRSRYVPAFPLPRDLRADELETPFVAFYCVTGMGPFALHRRSVLDRIGGYDERLWSHEDADLFCRMALEGCVIYLPERLYAKREMPGTLTQVGQQRGGGDAFHRKWRDYQHHDPRRQAEIDRAKRYYYKVHVPLRDLKVARKALMEFVISRDPSKLRFAARLLLHAAASPFAPPGRI